MTFLPAQAAREATHDEVIRVLPQATADAQVEAAQLAVQIARLRAQHPQWRIAVLVQTRTVAPPVLAALEQAGVPTLGVELASLAQRQVVRDLIAIGRALQDGADRTAWLALLHMPACGLSLRELQSVCGDDIETPLIRLLAVAGADAALDAATRERLRRLTPLLREAWEGRGRTDIATAVESLWRRLGGWHACRSAGERNAALQYLAALRRACDSEGLLDGQRLQALAEGLRDAGATSGENPVEILTIHHSKGLEWDAVFVPGLGRRPRSDQPPLLQWLELPATGGDVDLLLAVRSLGEAVAGDALSKYIGGLRRGRQDNERVRLVYVAVTRARHFLCLSGHAPWNDKQQRPVAPKGSLLQVLWPAIHAEFAALPAPEPGGERESPVRRDLQSAWHPLPAGFAPPLLRESLRVESLSGGEREPVAGPEYDWVGPAARAIGTLVHAELEQYALTGLPDVAVVPERAGFFVSRLRELGMEPQQSRRLAADVVGKLSDMVRDTRAQWLFNEPHARRAASGACPAWSRDSCAMSSSIAAS